MSDKLIPEPEEGIQTNTESSVTLPDQKEGNAFYGLVRDRLLQVNRWHELAGKASARFCLTDDKGNEVDRPARTGDHIRIDIPGPRNKTGEGDDWVRIEAMDEFRNKDEEELVMRVRPSGNPRNDRQEVAHFFSDDATSTFVVKRVESRILAGVYGRNEKPNTGTNTTGDKIRNAVVATGALSGYSKIQWKSLVNGLLSRD